MDTIVIIAIFIILLIVALVFKRASNVIVFFGLIDIFLRILDYIGKHTSDNINNFINKIFPDSIPAIINSYSTELLESILMWIYVGLMILFLYYVFRMLIHRL